VQKQNTAAGRTEQRASERRRRAPAESASPFICLPERKQTRHIVEEHRVLLVGEQRKSAL
jgi:hypothetical protein